jgi:hypothetical protein
MKSRQSLSLIVARLLSTAVTFVSMRLFLQWFGREINAAFTFAASLGFFISLIDVGVYVGGARRITEAFHLGDDEAAWRINRVQFSLGLIVTIFSLIAFPLVALVQPLEGFTTSRAMLFLELMAIQFCCNWFVQYIAAALSARGRFGLQGTLTFLTSFGGTFGSLVFGFATHDVMCIAEGAAAGSIAGLLLGILQIRLLDREYRFGLAFDLRLAKDLIHQGLTNYPNRVAGTFSNRSDRPIIYSYQPALANDYQYICRPAEVLTDLLGSAIETMQPEATRSSLDGHRVAAAKLHRNSLLVWTLACSFLVVPCSVGSEFLRMWVPSMFSTPAGFEAAALVMICASLNYAGELHYRALGTAYVAKGTLYRSVWFPALNGVATVMLTLPILKSSGGILERMGLHGGWSYPLLGVGLMNAAFSLVQLYPRIKHVGRETGGHFEVGAHFRKSMAIFGVACGWTLVGLFLAHSWASPTVLLFGPALSVLTFLLCIQFGLTPKPSFLELPKRGLAG